jgi:hypothetical protein
VRNLLAIKFNIPTSGSREVSGGFLVSDGRTPEDLWKGFTVKALQTYTGMRSTDVYEMFAVSVEMVKEELNPHEEPITKKSAHTPKSAGHDDESGAGKKPARAKGAKGKGGKSVVAPVPQEV